MRGFSKAIIAGNLVRDPEIRATPSGAQVCSFAVAVNRSYKGNDGNQVEQVSYIDCVAWGKTGETISQYMHKGSPILVSGRLEQRSWEDKNSGQRRSRSEIVVEDFSFIGTGATGAGSGGGSSSRDAGAAEPDLSDEVAADDIPDDDQINLDEIPF